MGRVGKVNFRAPSKRDTHILITKFVARVIIDKMFKHSSLGNGKRICVKFNEQTFCDKKGYTNDDWVALLTTFMGGRTDAN